MYRVLAIAAMVVLSGCSAMGVGTDKFQCGEGKDKNCSSVTEVYQNTNGPVGNSKAQKPAKATDLISTIPAMGAAIDDSNWPRPILEPAQVMRIWIAPWVDEKDSLHWPSYVFTEVKSRRWTYGQSDFRSSKQLIPLQIERRQGLENDTADKSK